MSQHGCPERLSNRSKGFQEEGASQPTMEVLVETLTGTAFEMTVSPSDTIFAIKSKICRVEGIPVSQQHLLYNLKEVEDGWSLRSLGITDGARLRLVLGMRGGPISTRRLPPPAEPWRDIERLLDTNREDADWGAGSGSGCKVTVLVFRDGERVNMVRVRENHDGTYSPLDHAKYSSSLRGSSGSVGSVGSGGSGGEGGGGGAVTQNAVTMGKMLELRARMETLSVRRRADRPNGDKPEIQKTRSEETLSVPSLLDETAEYNRTYTPYSEEDSFAPLYDGNYTRYDYDCSFADRYTLLPPIGTRTDSEQSVTEAVSESERVKLSEALAGSILVSGRAREGEEAILEELDKVPDRLRQDSPPLPADTRPAVPAADYGGVVGGETWWAGGEARSALSVRGAGAAPLVSAVFSSSTSDLEALRRGRLLPKLSRHRNREHLHLSDDALHLHRDRRPPPADAVYRFGDYEDRRDSVEPPKEKEVKEKKIRIRCGFCKKKLSIATVHRCRCGAEFCAPHRYAEVHGCAYDYKTNAHLHLQRANPLVSAPKLPKI